MPGMPALGHIKTRECAIEELLSASEAGDLESIRRLLDGPIIDVNAPQWAPRQLALGIRETWPRWGAEADYTALHCAASFVSGRGHIAARRGHTTVKSAFACSIAGNG